MRGVCLCVLCNNPPVSLSHSLSLYVSVCVLYLSLSLSLFTLSRSLCLYSLSLSLSVVCVCVCGIMLSCCHVVMLSCYVVMLSCCDVSYVICPCVISLRGYNGQRVTPHNSATSHLCYLPSPLLSYIHTFSAFWLRSSVVSVLISLISDSESIAFLQD
jgi:hypothetical protein